MSITMLNLCEDLWRSNVLGAIFRSGKTKYIRYKMKTCYYFIYIFTVTFLQSQDNFSIYNVCNLYNEYSSYKNVRILSYLGRGSQSSSLPRVQRTLLKGRHQGYAQWHDFSTSHTKWFINL